MFGFSDFIGFVWAFLVIYPLVSLVHIGGHAFFARLFGGRFTVSIGHGKRIFQKGSLCIHRMYFLGSFCDYNKLRWNNRLTHFLVHAGGFLFNLTSVFLLNFMIVKGYLEPRKLFEQFSYFSLWFAAFSLLPVDYGQGKYSDGLSVYYVLRYRKWPALKD